MIKCDNLQDLINTTITQGDDLNCWVYTNLEKWRKSPYAAEFFFIDEDEVEEMDDDEIYKTDDGAYLPISLKGFDLYAWFESDILAGVIENASIGHSPNQEEIERFVFAANHYREYDDFYDYPAT